jgi:hypothetical protein
MIVRSSFTGSSSVVGPVRRLVKEDVPACEYLRPHLLGIRKVGCETARSGGP